MVDVYLLDKALEKVKEMMDFEKFDNIKIVIDADGKLLMILL